MKKPKNEIGFFVCFLICFATAGCSSSRPIQVEIPLESVRLNKTIRDYTEAKKRLDPFDATVYDVEEDLDKFGDYPSAEFFERNKALHKGALRALEEIHEQALDPKERLTYSLFKEDMENTVRSFDFPFELLDFNQMENRLQRYMDDSSESLTSFPFDSVKHYEAFLKRSQGFPSYVEHQIGLLERGIREGVVLNCVAARETPNSYKDALVEEVEKNPFWRPVLFMPKSFSPADRERLTREFRQMVETRIIPGYKKLAGFFEKSYLPHCRKEYGIGSLRRGKEMYAQAIKLRTGLSLSAKEVHQLGLKEVHRISSEMEKIKTSLGYKGSLVSFVRSISQSPKHFFGSPEEMFHAFEKVKAQVASKVPEYFSLIPKSDYNIVESSNSADAAASYRMPTDMVPHGRFVVNTKNLRSVPDYEVTTLSLHEAVPGHHFQLALQYEMKDRLSEYQRKIFSSVAFAEGWALYAEHLGNEMGMYSDPWQRLGNLGDEMLRAVRLVVDTGIHAYGWSHDKTVAYMARYLPADKKDIENEANRYSVWPGQALGYKIGQLKILELRGRAEKELGSRFNIKEFHRVVIGDGTLSLNILDTQIRNWIKSKK